MENKDYALLNWNEGNLEKFSFIEGAVDDLITEMYRDEIEHMYDEQVLLIVYMSENIETIQLKNCQEVLQAAINFKNKLKEIVEN